MSRSIGHSSGQERMTRSLKPQQTISIPSIGCSLSKSDLDFRVHVASSPVPRLCDQGMSRGPTSLIQKIGIDIRKTKFQIGNVTDRQLTFFFSTSNDTHDQQAMRHLRAWSWSRTAQANGKVHSLPIFGNRAVGRLMSWTAGSARLV